MRRHDIDRVVDARYSIARKLKGLYAEFRFARDCGEPTARLEEKIHGAEQAVDRLDNLAAELVAKSQRP